jgi:hypothetical protein
MTVTWLHWSAGPLVSNNSAGLPLTAVQVVSGLGKKKEKGSSSNRLPSLKKYLIQHSVCTPSPVCCRLLHTGCKYIMAERYRGDLNLAFVLFIFLHIFNQHLFRVTELLIPHLHKVLTLVAGTRKIHILK